MKPAAKASEDLLAAGASLDAIAKEKAAKQTEAEKQKAADIAAKKQAEDARAAAAANDPRRTDKPAAATQETPTTLLASLNTKMEQLIKLTAQTTTNTHATYEAAKSLNGNLYKA